MGSALINVIAVHPSAGETPPVDPGAGENVESWAGYVTIGSEHLRTHDANLDQDSITLEIEPGMSPIRPPLALGAVGWTYEGSYMIPWEFTCFDISEELLSLGSNIESDSANISQLAAAATKRTVIVEYNGFKQLVIPEAYLMYTGETVGVSGEGGVARTKFTVFAEATAVYKGGFYNKFYQ